MHRRAVVCWQRSNHHHNSLPAASTSHLCLSTSKQPAWPSFQAVMLLVPVNLSIASFSVAELQASGAPESTMVAHVAVVLSYDFSRTCVVSRSTQCKCAVTRHDDTT